MITSHDGLSAAFMNNTDIPHNDITKDDFPLSANTTDATGPPQCQQYCDAHNDCVGWVYVRPGHSGPRCAIKSAFDGTSTSSCCISGVKYPTPPTLILVINTSQVGDRTGSNVIKVPLPQLQGQRATLRVLADNSVVEVFAQDGQAVATTRVYTNEQATGLWAYGDGKESMEVTMLAHNMSKAVI
jgi:hypothetical protein